MKPIEIPQHQEDPQWIIIWPIDELIPIMLAIGFGVFFEQVLLLLIIGYGVSRAYRTAKATRQNGFIQHWLYSKGIYPFTTTKTLKNTFTRKFIPR